MPRAAKPKEPKPPKEPKIKKKQEKAVERHVIIQYYGDALTDEERQKFIVSFPSF